MDKDDNISYYKVFKYLNTEYNFNPKIINTDYDPQLVKALKSENLFKEKPEHNYCYFTYEKFLRERIRTISNHKKSFSLCCLEILINIEIISFINKDKIEEMKKIIIDTLKKNYDCSKLFLYINKNWISHFINELNYSDYLNNTKPENINFLKQLYRIKNISEICHKNLDLFIPKYAISINSFVNQFKKLFSSGNINIKNNFENFYYRYDFQLKTIIYIINEHKLNEKTKWNEIKNI